MIPCPQCGTTIANREELPKGEASIPLVCPQCGLGVVTDTREEQTDGSSNR